MVTASTAERLLELMSIFKNHTGAGLARRAKAFLNLEVRLYQSKQTARKLARREQELAALRAILAKRDTGEQDISVRPENIVWVFGSGRTGSIGSPS